jgi:hypothetical protein
MVVDFDEGNPLPSLPHHGGRASWSTPDGARRDTVQLLLEACMHAPTQKVGRGAQAAAMEDCRDTGKSFHRVPRGPPPLVL